MVNARMVNVANEVGSFTMRLLVGIPALALACCLSANAHGQGAADFYKNRQMRLIVGHAVGNDYDVGARVLAKHLPKHIPG